jgi:hypothetical protein
LEVIPFIVLVYFGAKYFGIVGAAVVVLLRTIADTLLLAKCSGLAGAVLRLSTTPALLLASCAIVGISLPLDSAARWIIAACVAVASLVWFVLWIPREIAEQIVHYGPILKALPFGSCGGEFRSLVRKDRTGAKSI